MTGEAKNARLRRWFQAASENILSTLANFRTYGPGGLLSGYQVAVATRLPEDMVKAVLEQLEAIGRVVGSGSDDVLSRRYEAVLTSTPWSMSGVDALGLVIDQAKAAGAREERARIVRLLRDESSLLDVVSARVWRWVALFVDIEADGGVLG